MELYDYQKRVARVLRQGKSVILQAPTGAGKTFASLLPFFQAWTVPEVSVPKKCIYSVPMRVLANQFIQEYERFVKEELRQVAVLPRVTIQTGERAQDPEFRADLTFATIDQVLSGWLMHPYSLSRRKGNLNAGALVGNYLVFDEFHLFDPDSTLPTTLHMLRLLKGISPFVLMTATFSAEMLEALGSLLDAEPILLTADDLTEVGSQQKERRFYLKDEPLVVEEIAQPSFVVDRHEAQEGAYKRSLVIFNQVERAQRFYQALQKATPVGTEVRLLHSRFRVDDRQRIEEEVRREFGKEKAAYQHESMIVVATQVIEVGLDATSRVLHTELAPAASVLQRAGRCARYQGEVGEVYMYPVESYAPYHEREAKAQCVRTEAWLRERQGQHMDFEAEQTWVNHAHGPTDKQILAQLEAGSFAWAEEVQALWRGEGDRGRAARLIRNIQSQGLIVHGNPDQLLDNPFAVEVFSLHPGTLQGKFERWEEIAEDDRERAPLPWAVCRLVEVDAEEEASRPVQYEWKKVRHKFELLGAPLVAVQPTLVGYRSDLGLTLYPTVYYEAEVPEKEERRTWHTFYRLETYTEHVRLVYEAFREEEAEVRATSRRLENAYGWRPGMVSEMAQLVVWLHDLGKLGIGWQGWAQAWQAAIGQPYGSKPVAHTDYDSANPQHLTKEKALKSRRPPHAMESALAAIPYLLTVTDEQIEHSLFRAGFTAIARHHGPFTRESGGYELVPEVVQALVETAQLLPRRLRLQVSGVAGSSHFAPRLDVSRQLGEKFIRDQLLIQPAYEQDVVTYMCLVRMLRRADQEGTMRGAK